MRKDDFDNLKPYDQEMVLLFGRIAKALERLAQQMEE